VKDVSKTVKDAFGPVTDALNVANDAVDTTIRSINAARQVIGCKHTKYRNNETPET
jgi:hypothetical protein